MNNKFKIIELILASSITVFTLASLISCGDNSDGNKDDANSSETTAVTISPEKQALLDNVKIFFNDMYSKFNEKDFDAYISYWGISQDEKDTMKSNFDLSSTLFDTAYTVDSIDAAKNEDGTISVAIITISTSVNKKSEFKTVIKETQYFMLSDENDVYSIIKYASGESEILDYSE